MKIHYDNIVFSLQRAGGISTYWSELITRLLRDEIDVTFDEFAHRNIVRDSFVIQPAHVNFLDHKSLLYHRFKSLGLPGRVEPFIFHSSYNRITNNPKAAQVTTVHDFVHEQFYKGIRRGLHLMQKKRVLKAADQIITVSENTKRDLMRFHPGIPEQHIHVVYNGVSTDFYPLTDEDKRFLPEATKRPYLLFVGSREHYKNFKFTVELLSECKDMDLYIVGNALTKKELELLLKRIPNRWEHFQHISNFRLNQLYNMALALIYPSSYEGFGIPLLEAMKAGAPFMALNNSSIPEVAGEAGVLLSAPDIALFKDALSRIQHDGETFRAKGFKQAEQFSWEKCYQQTLSIYKSLA